MQIVVENKIYKAVAKNSKPSASMNPGAAKRYGLVSFEFTIDFTHVIF